MKSEMSPLKMKNTLICVLGVAILSTLAYVRWQARNEARAKSDSNALKTRQTTSNDAKRDEGNEFVDHEASELDSSGRRTTPPDSTEAMRLFRRKVRGSASDQCAAWSEYVATMRSGRDASAEWMAGEFRYRNLPAVTDLVALALYEVDPRIVRVAISCLEATSTPDAAQALLARLESPVADELEYTLRRALCGRLEYAPARNEVSHWLEDPALAGNRTGLILACATSPDLTAAESVFRDLRAGIAADSRSRKDFYSGLFLLSRRGSVFAQETIRELKESPDEEARSCFERLESHAREAEGIPLDSQTGK